MRHDEGWNNKHKNQNTPSKTETWFLTEEAKDFITKPNKIDINLYLSQNRYCCEKKEVTVRGEKKTERRWLEPHIMRLIDQNPISSDNLNLKCLLDRLVGRNKELAAGFKCHRGYNAKFPCRVILGEGGNTPYSNIVLLKLHPLYGVPYVPASTIKGVLRSCWNALYTQTSGDEDPVKRAKKKETEDLLFGTADEKKTEGGLIFFDTFPEEFTLTLDVETPHYPEYYSEGKSPTDDQKIMPIKIICMEKVSLPIYIACQNEILLKNQEEEIKSAVKHMIEVYGIGAKTSLGYGIGELIDNSSAVIEGQCGANHKLT